MIIPLIFLILLHFTDSSILFKPFSETSHCNKVVNPHWPFAYTKTSFSQVESKGRYASNIQNFALNCSVLGVQEKCHRCEKVNGFNFQIQGMINSTLLLPRNTPTVSDVPFVVGGKHRYDFEGASKICLILEGGHCTSPVVPHFAFNYTSCRTRCWSGERFYQVSRTFVSPRTLIQNENETIFLSAVDENTLSYEEVQRRLVRKRSKGEVGLIHKSKSLKSPKDIAVDYYGNIFIVDSVDHCIKRFSNFTKRVTTIAGVCGTPGFLDSSGDNALFNSPQSVTLFYGDEETLSFLNIVVSDTLNHRLRRLVYNFNQEGDLVDWISADVTVSTFSGRLGQSVKAGFQDGSPVDAKFNHPLGLDIDRAHGFSIYVADSFNHLIRKVLANGNVYTIAGKLEREKNCKRFPCLVGVEGVEDGTLKTASFRFPQDVSVDSSGNLFITESNRIRLVQIKQNLVSVLVGSLSPGDSDGLRNESHFSSPKGIVVTTSNQIFVADEGNCKIKRISKVSDISQKLSCAENLFDIFMPDGCASVDDRVNAVNLRISSLSGNIYREFRRRQDRVEFPVPYSHWLQDSNSIGTRGKIPKRCVGTPPLEQGRESDFVSLGIHSGTSWKLFTKDENIHKGTVFYITCFCKSSDFVVQYAEENSFFGNSSICGAIWNVFKEVKGVFRVEILDSVGVSVADHMLRFSVSKISDSETVLVETVVGAPAADLETNFHCGYNYQDADLTLPLEAKLNLPFGLAVNKYNLHDEFTYFADSGNHAIRYFLSPCSKNCENGGICSAKEGKCMCKIGWKGEDCTLPSCSNEPPSTNVICSAPNTWSCVPGYASFPDCQSPLCVQICENGGFCSAPDTCTCAVGWFDSNCSTPVCSQTCGNGGNCTGPNMCTCPQQWTGLDCRSPLCTQSCRNNGVCVAPNTCRCLPEWSGFDCSQPVCFQGFLAEADQEDVRFWEMYEPCDLEKWCDDTNDFDCQQVLRKFNDSSLIVDVRTYFGEKFRERFGFDVAFRGDMLTRGVNGEQCLRIELNPSLRTHFASEDINGNRSEAWLLQPINPFYNSSGFSDRVIALVQLRSVPQGKYKCANGGNCVLPGTCKCHSGWIGFDCRIPVCTQGWYEPSIGGKVWLHNLDFIDQVDQSYFNVVEERYLAQGMYQCSIRSLTEWENEFYVHNHPNFFSRFMDKHEGSWETEFYWDNWKWPPTHVHTLPEGNYTTEGWRREGFWEAVEFEDSRFGRSLWRKGLCTTEFIRTCESELLSKMFPVGLATTDTEAAFGYSANFSDKKVESQRRWRQGFGECVDVVVRGCYNNGTCVGPNLCKCSPGWTGSDCSIPVCQQSCSRKLEEVPETNINSDKVYSKGTGNCTLPDICTCEKGWAGSDCSVPLCAQECNNEGKCVMPDTCECWRWRSKFMDERVDGGWPLFRDSEGNAQLTGWTGFDCSTPICTQAATFYPIQKGVGNVRLGGYGLILFGEEPYNNILRPDLSQPPYFPFTLTTDIPPEKVYLPRLREYNQELFVANSEIILELEYMLCRKFGFRYCSLFPTAEPFQQVWGFGDGEIVRNDGRSYQSGCKFNSNRFSDYDDRDPNSEKAAKLCEVESWEQGDYKSGRYIRVNNDATAYIKNYLRSSYKTGFGWDHESLVLRSEGIYACEHFGSCISPDVCSCPDGYTGFDCSVPLCRHRQVTNLIVACLNGGKCVSRDTCQCRQWPSQAYKLSSGVLRGMTGYNGTDCSIPICLQGEFDKTCKDTTLGGEGCFRCKNNGNCTAPDYCTCSAGWKGFDCTEPICNIRADEKVLIDLNTLEKAKVRLIELDPCLSSFGHGNCTAPGVCTCACFNVKTDSWRDYFSSSLPTGFSYGRKSCSAGYEGMRDRETGLFKTCHLRIFEPYWWQKYTLLMMILAGVLSCLSCWAYLENIISKRQLALLRKVKKRKTAIDQGDQDKIRRRRQKQGTTDKKIRHTNKKAK